MGKKKMVAVRQNPTKRKGTVVEFESDDKREEFRKKLKLQQKDAMSRPKIYLLSLNTLSYLPHNSGGDVWRHHGAVIPDLEKFNVPIYPNDVQHLISSVIEGNKARYKPRWCRVLRASKVSAITLVIVPHVTQGKLDHYVSSNTNTHLNKLFEMRVELIPASFYGCDLINEILNIPVSSTEIYVRGEVSMADIDGITCKPVTQKSEDVKREGFDAEVKRAGSSPWWEDSPWLTCSGCVRYPAALYPDHSSIPHPHRSQCDVVDRTTLILSTQQMMLEGYPLPTIECYSKFVSSKCQYTAVTSDSPMFGVDCEMVRTVDGASALARISVVDEDYHVVYDSLVKPERKIEDYMTQYSGVTARILEPITVRLADVHKELQRVLPPDAILCGQSLNSDLIAMKMYHPYNIDTSVIYRLRWGRAKTSLKMLTKLFLGDNIQQSRYGHDSIEDAKAALQLVQLKLSKGLEFGDINLESGPGSRFSNHTEQDAAHKFNYFNRTGYYRSSLSVMKDLGKPSLIIDSNSNFSEGEIYASHKLFVTKFVGCERNRSCVEAYEQQQQQGECAALGACYFTLVHLHKPQGESHSDRTHMRKIEKHIRKIHAASPDRSLLIVLLEGSRTARTKSDAGVCLLKIKRDAARQSLPEDT